MSIEIFIERRHSMENQLENATLAAEIQKVMEYFGKIREIGALDIFVQLFQNDFRILSYLETHRNIHPSSIASDLRISRPNVAANLRILEAKRFIVRTIDSENRRQIFVDITPAGLRYLAIIKEQCARLFASWFEILGEEEVQHLFHILEKSSNPAIITKDVKNFNFGDNDE